MRTNKIYIIRYTAFAFALGIMTLIFVMSAQDATRSSAASGGFIRSIAPLIKSNFHQLSSPEQEGFIESLQYIVRKAAHFNVYALLAVLVATGVFTFDRLKNVFGIILSLFVCILYSISDEIHQSFVPGRSCELRDVIIDTFGALLGCSIFWGISLLIKRKRACRN